MNSEVFRGWAGSFSLVVDLVKQEKLSQIRALSAIQKPRETNLMVNSSVLPDHHCEVISQGS